MWENRAGRAYLPGFLLFKNRHAEEAAMLYLAIPSALAVAIVYGAFKLDAWLFTP